MPLGPGKNRIRNVGSWLDTALDQNIELVIIHDTVDKEEIEMFLEIIEPFNSNRLITSSVNFGNPGETRNAGKALATGQWIVFWDSDDLPLIDNFMHMVNLGHSVEADYCLGGFQIVQSQNSEIEYFLPSNSRKQLLVEIAAYPGIWRFAFKKSAIQDVWFQSFCMGEDQAFLLEAIEDVSNLYVYDGIVYEYRKSEIGQLTSSSESRRQILDSILWLWSGGVQFAQYPLFKLFLASQILTSAKELGFSKGLKSLATAIYLKQNSVLVHMFKILHMREKMNHRSGAVTIYLTGGLGNQLFQVSQALGIAKGRRLCIASYKQDEINQQMVRQLKEGAYFFQDKTRINSLLNPPLVSLVLRLTSSKFLWVRYLQFAPRILSKFANGWHTRLNRVTDVGFEEKDNRDPNVLIGYFQSYLYVDKALLKRNLGSNYSDKTNQILERYRLLSKAESPTLVHVRLGDYRMESRFGNLEREYYLNAIQLIKMRSQLKAIWLFSNEPDEAIKFFPVEMWQRIRIVNEPTLSSLENLEIMKMCSNYVIANSTYSWWAAFLSLNGDPFVIYPSPWFKKMKSPRSIAPPTWMPLEGYNHSKSH